MAEFLVMRADRGTYRRGDIVAAMPDGWKWGKEEHPDTAPKPWVFVLVKVPGLNPEAARVLKVLTSEDGPDGSLTLRRVWKLHDDLIPQTFIDQLRNTGIVTVTVAQIQNFIRNKRTGATF